MKPLPIALLVATTILLPAATPLAGQNLVSVQVGTVRSSFWGSDHSHATIGGRSMRATLAVPLTGALAIRVDGGYAEKGAATVGEIYDSHMRLGYAEFSALLKASTRLGSVVSGHLLAGPAVGIKTHCAIETAAEGISVKVDCDEAEQNVQPTDIGASLGAGFDLAISGGRYRISLDFLHTMGLVSALGDGQHKNSATAFLLGFGWPIGQ